MQSNYKRLGDYIRQVDVRNRDLAVDNLVGLTIEKAFIPSVANTIGTDLSNYKVISNGQFACSLMQVSRDGKMPIAMFKGEKGIMSPAYPMFEVYRKDELLPEFLMMWFSRKEFDREVTFWAVGGVRGSLTWEDFENLNIPVPSIEKQRKIVAEYQAVERRIENNRRLIATLESTAQTIYRHMFVDNIDPENLPQGWRMGKLGNVVVLSQGIQVEVDNQFSNKQPGFNRFIRIIDYTPGTNEPPRFVNISDKRYFCSASEVSMIRYGDAGKVCRRLSGIIANNLFKISPMGNITNNFIYCFLRDENTQRIIRGSAASSTMPAITHETIKELDCGIPSKDALVQFDKYVNPIEKDIVTRMSEYNWMLSVQSLLLSKISN